MGGDDDSDRVYYSLNEAAIQYGVSTRTLRRYIAKGTLPAFKFNGRNVRIKREDLDRLMHPVPPDAD